ncbi:ricin-type beta-trefoil lectin domain protein [Kitasatospora sp. NPDC002543]
MRAAGGLCLSTRDNALVQSTQAVMRPCAGLDGQKWTYRADGTLRNTVADLCLDLPNGATAPGTRPMLWPCSANPNQRWLLNPEKA